MRQLAVEGGKPIVRTPIKPLISIGNEEIKAATRFLEEVAGGKASLSGYLAGSARGGAAVQRLEDIWCREFGCRYAIACSSGTSAILAAYAVTDGKRILMPALGMSAIAAAAKILKATIRFLDCQPNYLVGDFARPVAADTLMVVNLFGRPAPLQQLRALCSNKIWLIEDNAQAPWATTGKRFAGTVGHIGCWSMNVHKPLNAGGEGGMLTTNNDALAERLRLFINHGEMAGEAPGLNLRMPELTAVLLLAQLPRAKRTVERRREIAYALGWVEEPDCISSPYCFPILAPAAAARPHLALMLRAEGVPVAEGYPLLNRLFGGKRCPRAEELESRLLLIELCSIDPTDEQVKEMREAIETVLDIV